MGASIQLIQLTLRVEREEARRRPQKAHRDDLADEKPLRPLQRDNRVISNCNLPQRQQWCECA
jgi:hypothetical protein